MPATDEQSMKSLITLLFVFTTSLAWSQVATTPPFITLTPTSSKIPPPAVRKLLERDVVCSQKHKFQKGIPDLVKMRIRISIGSSLKALEDTTTNHCGDDKKANPYVSCLMTTEIRKDLFVLLKKNPKVFDAYVKDEYRLSSHEAAELRGFYLNLCRK